jgi:hypothetical protein
MYTLAGNTIQRSPFVCITISLALHVILSMYHELAEKNSGYLQAAVISELMQSSTIADIAS